MKYTQEQQNQILSRINAGVIGKRKQKTWDSIAIRTKWSKEKVLEYCKKYNNYSELSTGALNYALKNGFIEEAIAHMDKNIKWDFKQAKTVAKLYKTRKEFSLSKYQSAYNWAIRENKLDQICSHMPKHKFEVSKETVYALAKTCKNPTELSNKKFSYYKQAKKEGWLNEWFPKK